MINTAVVKCENYDQQCVYDAVRRAIQLTGGLDDIVKPGDTVVLKTNLLKAHAPEDCVTTHPSVLRALALALTEAGAKVIIGDSPAGTFNEGRLRSVYKAAGIDKLAKLPGVSLNYDCETVEEYHPEAKRLRQFQTCHYLMRADLVIDCAKLKTHGMTTYSGAVKNLYGTIPGTVKLEYHYRMQSIDDFADMLVDICEFIRPALSVIDAVWGMDGDGPSAGDPKYIGAIVMSRSAYDADIAGISLMNYPPKEICTVKSAAARGLCGMELSDISLVGDNIQDLIARDFRVSKLPNTNEFTRYIPPGLRKAASKILSPRPIFVKKKCVGCGECERSCPAHAITILDGMPSADLEKCIRCFCCQELCPKKAVRIKRNMILQKIK